MTSQSQPLPRRRARLTRVLRLLVFALVAAVALFWLGLATAQVNRIAQPIRSTPWATPGVHYEAVMIQSRDGLKLAAWYIPSRNRAAVILIHGWESNRAGMLAHIAWLAKAGFGVLAFDLRAHGESEGMLSTFGWSEIDDITGALDYLDGRQDVDAGRIGAYGFSLGGQIVLRAAVQDSRIRAVMADDPGLAAPADEPLPADLAEALIFPAYALFYPVMAVRTGVGIPPALIYEMGRIAPRPVMLIASGQFAPNRIARRYFAAAGEPKTFREVPETGHGGTWVVRPSEYERWVIEFFEEGLLQ